LDSLILKYTVDDTVDDVVWKHSSYGITSCL